MNDELQMEWFLPKLAVTFGNEGEAPKPGESIREAFTNLHGSTHSTHHRCGDCNISRNYSSKNALDYTPTSIKCANRYFLAVCKSTGKILWLSIKEHSYVNEACSKKT